MFRKGGVKTSNSEQFNQTKQQNYETLKSSDNVKMCDV